MAKISQPAIKSWKIVVDLQISNIEGTSLRTFSFVSFITTGRGEWSCKWHIFISKPTTLEMIYWGNLSCGVFTLYFYCLSLMGFFLNNNPTKFIVYFFLLRVNERFPFISCNFWLWRHFSSKAGRLINSIVSDGAS